MNPFTHSPLDYYTSGAATGIHDSIDTNDSNDPSSSHVTTARKASSENSVFRRMFWNHYSSGLHFFGGSLFPNTTTTTTSLYNNSNSSNLDSNSNHCSAHGEDSRTNDHNTVHSANKSSSYHHHSLSAPRPTDQLLKLIRRRRNTTASNNNTAADAQDQNNNGQSNDNNVSDDSWNAVRYHIVSRPADCRYVCYSSNRSTPLHAACLYRAPHDVILMLLTAWPAATLQQDAEGWTPLHVHILYNNANHNIITPVPTASTAASNNNNYYFTTTTTSATASLIRTGGAEAAARHSKFVGSALHLACRHVVSLPVFAELLQVCPGQVFIPNEAGGLPANLLWKAMWKEKTRHYQQLMRQRQQRFARGEGNDLTNQYSHEPQQQGEWELINHEYNVDLMVRLNLLLGAFQNSPILLEQAQRIQPSNTNNPSSLFPLHDLIQFHYECANQADYVQLFLKFYPNSASFRYQKSKQLPLHVAASYPVNYDDDKAFMVYNANNASNTPTTTVLITNDEDDDDIAIVTAVPLTNTMAHQDRFVWPPQVSATVSTNSIPRRRNQNNYNNMSTRLSSRLQNRFQGSFITFASSTDSFHGNEQLTQQDNQPCLQDPLLSVLQAFPNGAYLKEAKSQRIPLHIALITGKRTWHTGIASLVAVAPETVEWKDESTQLYPFQLAALPMTPTENNTEMKNITTTNTTTNNNNNNNNNNSGTDNSSNTCSDNQCTLSDSKNDRSRSLAQLETIYFLLLSCPHVVAHEMKEDSQC